MKVTLLVHHIKWDTGGDEEIERSLPTKMEMVVDLASSERLFPMSVDEEIRSNLLEVTGRNVLGYKLQGYSAEADLALQMAKR